MYKREAGTHHPQSNLELEGNTASSIRFGNRRHRRRCWELGQSKKTFGLWKFYYNLSLLYESETHWEFKSISSSLQFFLLRQLGAIVAAGLAALLGANIFAGTSSEAILDDSPSQRNQK